MCVKEKTNFQGNMLLCFYSYFPKPIDGTIYSFKGGKGMPDKVLTLFSTRMYVFLLALVSDEIRTLLGLNP